MAVYRNRAKYIADRLILLNKYIKEHASPIHAVKASEMIEFLAGKGHHIKIKTLYADLNILETSLGLKMQYDEHKKGYILIEPEFEPYELRMIVNSIQAAKFITQQEADSLTDKIIGIADEYTRPSLNRRTFVKNRVRTINEDLMKGLDTIYEAIAQDRKISYKHFYYTLSGCKQTKEYRSESGSKTIIASPYEVSWDDDGFSVLSVRTIKESAKDMASIEDIYDMDEDEGIDYIDDVEELEDREVTLFCYDELRYMEQIKILPDKREGRDIAQKGIEHEKEIDEINSRKKTRLKVSNMYITDVIEKFGNDVIISPADNEFFVATINEKPSPELYMWTRTFFPQIEIVFPMDAEAKLQRYFFDISQGNHVMPSIIYDFHYLNLDQEEVDEPFSD